MSIRSSPAIEPMKNRMFLKSLVDIFSIKKAKANYNMSFAGGNFIKNNYYNYKFDRFDNLFYVTTEEGKKQDFYPYEFNTYFSIF
jgi:hypothetical protein